MLRRNYLLLQAGQAALGLIGRDLLGLATEPRPEEIVIHAAVARETAELSEDLRDMAAELDGFPAGEPESHSAIVARVHVGRPEATEWPGFQHALLYLAKPG